MTTNDSDDTKRQDSRLAKHLHLLGVETSSTATVDSLAREKRLLDAVGDLPGLDFARPEAQGSRPSRRSRQLSGLLGFAAAAGLTVLVFSQREDQDQSHGVRIKGDIGVATVYFDKDGQSGTLTPGTTLQDGTRVRVEVTAHGDSTAYMTVADRDSKLLTDPMGLKLDLKAGEKRFFPGALELTGESEGETILVLLCAADLDASISAMDLTTAFQTRQLDAALATCKLQAVPLR